MNPNSSSYPSPAKPWEKARASGNMDASSNNKPTTSSASTLQPQTNSTTSGSSMYTNSQNPHPSPNGMMNPQQPYMGRTGGYGSSGYGAMGGYGSSGYGAMGGYGSSSYGGYGAGGYGGYGAGGYGSNRMGMMMNNNPMMNNTPGGGPFGWLSSINQIVASIGQLTEILGMNAEALHFCFGSFVHLFERLSAMLQQVVQMLAPKPVFPPGHPRYGEPPLTAEEELSRLRRVRIVRFILSIAVSYFILRNIKRLARALGWTQAGRPLSSRKTAGTRRIEKSKLDDLFRDISSEIKTAKTVIPPSTPVPSVTTTSDAAKVLS